MEYREAVEGVEAERGILYQHRSIDFICGQLAFFAGNIFRCALEFG